MNVDLNLLVAWDALLQTRSVTAAAKRMHLSQPAMSRVLGRLREVTGDPILVRAGRGMVVSPRAEALRAEVAELVRRAHGVLTPAGALVPAQVERTFTMRCHDALLPRLGAALLRRLRDDAPKMVVRFVAESPSDGDGARQEPIDLDIGSAPRRGLGQCSEEVAHDTLSVAVRRNHPYAKQRPTPARFARGLHVLISRRGKVTDPLDEALARLGLQRRVVGAAPTSAAALHFVRDCNVLCVVATHACAAQVRSMGLVLRPLPFASPRAPIVQSWPSHAQDDRAHAWLRGVTRGILQEIAGS